MEIETYPTPSVSDTTISVNVADKHVDTSITASTPCVTMQDIQKSNVPIDKDKTIKMKVQIFKKQPLPQKIDLPTDKTGVLLNGTRFHKLPTPVKPDRLQFHLQGYNIWLAKYLTLGFTLGFKLNNFSFKSNDNDKTLKSAKQYPAVVDKKLDKELQSQRLMGPFETSPFTDPVISPLGVREKKIPGEFRLIHHLSYPYGESVNDGIPRELATVHYTPLSKAIQTIVDYGPNTYLAKSDIKSAFRIIPIHPSDYHLLGFKWGGGILFRQMSTHGGFIILCNIRKI